MKWSGNWFEPLQVMDKYRLDLKSEDDFEKIIVRICQDILGIGVIGFAKGKDGGRDARFEGKATNYPSSDGWRGKFIVQAKHTTDSEASCSDRTFFGNKSSIIADEIGKIKSIKADNEIDHYLCFTNRRLTGDKEAAIRTHILNETGIENAAILGIEYIERNLNREIIRDFGLLKNLLPFEFYEQDIRDIIVIFSAELNDRSERSSIIIEDIFNDKRHARGIAGKNDLNSLSKEYFDNEIQYNSLEYFRQIDDFLKHPMNGPYLTQYRNTTRELNNLILVKRGDFEKFEELFVFIYQQIFNGGEDHLRQHRSLIYVFLHFMYFQCDIGRNQ